MSCLKLYKNLVWDLPPTQNSQLKFQFGFACPVSEVLRYETLMEPYKRGEVKDLECGVFSSNSVWESETLSPTTPMDFVHSLATLIQPLSLCDNFTELH